MNLKTLMEIISTKAESDPDMEITCISAENGDEFDICGVNLRENNAGDVVIRILIE